MLSVSERTRLYPFRYADTTLASYIPVNDIQRTAKDAALEVAYGKIQNLVLVGPTGLGKTHLAVGIVKHIVARQSEDYEQRKAEMSDRWPSVPVDPMWANVADLIVALKMEMSAPPDDKTAEAMARQLRRHRALIVLDDLGREKQSDWTSEVIYNLVNSRYEERLPTVVTSNLTPADLSGSLYWPVLSRLAEDGVMVNLSGPDWRLTSHKPLNPER